ncbi:MAG: hypothetical protein KC777_00045 [Cyanobacteria bacterium HKST-UBA02]|nr:hypothetical protein [Cyanobacteria bacterium HKST-UBA02]
MSQAEKLDDAYDVLRLPRGASLKAVRRRRRAVVKLLDDERLSEMEGSFKTLLRHFTGGEHDGTTRCVCQPDRASYSATPFQGKQRKGFDKRTAIEEAIFQQAELEGQIWRWRIAIVYGVVFLVTCAWGWRQHISHPGSEWLRPRTLEELRPRAGERFSGGADEQYPGDESGVSPEMGSPGAAPDQAPRREPIYLPPELITPEMTAIQNGITARRRSIDNMNQQLSYLRKQKYIATPETATALDTEMARLLAARTRLESAIEQDQDRLYDLMKAAADAAAGEQEGDEAGADAEPESESESE